MCSLSDTRLQLKAKQTNSVCVRVRVHVRVRVRVRVGVREVYMYVSMYVYVYSLGRSWGRAEKVQYSFLMRFGSTRFDALAHCISAGLLEFVPKRFAAVS